MKRGILTTSRGLCATIVKQEQLTEYPTSPQILNLTSIYRQPLSATKDPQVHSQNTITVQPGGLTPHGPCYSPVAEVKHLAGRPQVFLQLFFLNLCMHIFFASARWAFTITVGTSMHIFCNAFSATVKRSHENYIDMC